MAQTGGAAMPGTITIYLDDAAEPLATYRPPAQFTFDTTKLEDGEHRLRITAVDTIGKVGVREIPFTVSNGPGITVTGLRAGSRVRGSVTMDINAFGADEPFDPVRAESHGPVPVWTWVLIVGIVVWAVWYGLEYFPTPPAFAHTPTYAPAGSALGAAQVASTTTSVHKPAVANQTAAGFDYATSGAQVYTQNCASCHGESGAGVPGAFPPLAGDPIVNGTDADAHLKIVLHGLSGKTIGGTKYSGQMPAFATQLNDDQIAAVVDHERTSWGNHGPIVTPGQVTRDR